MSATPAQKQAARRSIADYLHAAVRAAAGIHYSQARPLTCLGDPPARGFTTDCSGLCISAYRWASLHSGVRVPDPGGYAYNGYGYTGTLIRNPPAGGLYRVGDIALYGRSRSSTSHATICMTEGDASSSVWASHGSEPGPYAVRLHYRRDLITVVRPPFMR
jgi:cell wall-associated NlpC family hydrolase